MELAVGLDEAFPQAAALVRQQQHLGCAAAWYAVPQKPRRNDARFIDDQRVTGIQVVQNIVKMPVADFSGLAVQDHQPGGVPLLQRGLSNQLLRQVIVKIMCFQSPFLRI